MTNPLFPLEDLWTPAPKKEWSLDLPDRSTFRASDLTLVASDRKEEMIHHAVDRLVRWLKRDDQDSLPLIHEELDALAAWGVRLDRNITPEDRDNLLSAVIPNRTKTHFFPAVLERLEVLGLSSGLPCEDLQEKDVSPWRAAGGSAWAYALSKTADQPSSDRLFFSMCSVLIDHPTNEYRPKAFPFQSRLEVLWSHNPEGLRQHMATQLSDVKSRAELLKAYSDILKSAVSVTPQMEMVCEIILDPNKLGHPDVVSAFIRSSSLNISADQCLWLSRFLSSHPPCADLWQTSSTTATKFKSHQLSHVDENRYLGRHISAQNGNVRIKGGLLTHAIATGNTKLVQSMTHEEASRQSLVKAVLNEPNALMMLLLNKKETGVDERHLLAWGGDIIRQWRDEKGCCLAHYAAASAPTTAASDRILNQMINLVPEWRSVVRSDGVALMSLFKAPEAQARASRKELKDTTRTALKGQGSTKASTRRM